MLLPAIIARYCHITLCEGSQLNGGCRIRGPRASRVEYDPMKQLWKCFTHGPIFQSMHIFYFNVQELLSVSLEIKY